MVKINQVYRCTICGNIVEVTHAGGGQLICCGQNMNLLEEKFSEEGSEKHIPIIKKTKTGIIVKVGNITHPMEKKHYIEWIEIITKNKIYRRNLSPEMKPMAEFDIIADNIKAREYCTIHGLWQSK